MHAAASPNARFRDLSPGCRALVRLAQSVAFGAISFRVTGGQPDLSLPHRITRTVRLTGGSSGAHQSPPDADFELRKEHVALLEHLVGLADGTCVTVRIAHGLPGASFDIEEKHQAA